MTNEDFDLLVDQNVARLKKLMSRKGEEYSGPIDRLDNFKRAAAVEGVTPAEALFGMVNKHWTSIAMMMSDPTSHPMKQWREKTFDVIVYMFLLDAVLEDMGVK